jgi:para-aminobenzoate synthetase component 1
LRVRDGNVQTRPIKGTCPRSGDPAFDAELARELAQSDKDRAENVMIVDLMRNDLARVCHDESVRVEQLCQVEPYAFVQHLVSVVSGRLLPHIGFGDLLAACFPGGSITGAPKVEAMTQIARLEQVPRGPYCGSLGYIGCGGNAAWNILIRTITQAHGYWQIPAGGGITAASDPEAEYRETWHKAEGLLRAIPI